MPSISVTNMTLSARAKTFAEMFVIALASSLLVTLAACDFETEDETTGAVPDTRDEGNDDEATDTSGATDGANKGDTNAETEDDDRDDVTDGESGSESGGEGDDETGDDLDDDDAQATTTGGPGDEPLGCDLDGNECEADEDCPADSFCQFDSDDAECGTCRKLCTADADCPAGFACNAVTGVCAAPGSFCRGDEGCAETEMCFYGSCIALAPCGENFQCPLASDFGSICVDHPAWPGGPTLIDVNPWQMLFPPLCDFGDCSTASQAAPADCEEEDSDETADDRLISLILAGPFVCDARDNLCHPTVPMNPAAECPEGSYEVWGGRCINSCTDLTAYGATDCKEFEASCPSFGLSGVATACRIPAACENGVCPDGEACNPFDNTCVTPGSFCTSDDQCETATEMCYRGACVALPACDASYRCPITSDQAELCPDNGFGAWPAGPNFVSYMEDFYGCGGINELCASKLDPLTDCGLTDEQRGALALTNAALRCHAADGLCHPVLPMTIGECPGLEVFPNRCVNTCDDLTVGGATECINSTATCDVFAGSEPREVTACRVPVP